MEGYAQLEPAAAVSMLQVNFQDNTATQFAMLTLTGSCQAKLSGRSRFVDNTAAVAGAVVIDNRSTLEIQGNVCASNNTALPKLNPPGTASFAYLVDGESLRVADSASVQVDGDDPDVFIQQSVVIGGVNTEPGVLYCGSNPSTTSWQPGSYSITGDLCNCTQQFETEGNSTACDSCAGAGWDGELCACTVSARHQGLGCRVGVNISTPTGWWAVASEQAGCCPHLDTRGFDGLNTWAPVQASGTGQPLALAVMRCCCFVCNACMCVQPCMVQQAQQAVTPGQN